MARRRKGRPVNGILIIDKPEGRSSNHVLQEARWLYSAQKAGHTGSLDPLATGVLPICFGEATKFSQFLLDSDKAYRSNFTLGARTDTCDSQGQIIEQCSAVGITQVMVEEALKSFAGQIDQIPPMYSALKKDGQPLYKLARQGIEIERKARQVTIYKVELRSFSPADSSTGLAVAEVEIHCSKGTYIRSIADDLGQILKVGAHVSQLQRIKAGPFELQQSVSLEQLQAMKADNRIEEMDALLLPTQLATEHLPVAELDEHSAFYLRQGQAVQLPNLPKEGLVQLFTEAHEFLGLGEITDDGRVKPKRLLATSDQQ